MFPRSISGPVPPLSPGQIWICSCSIGPSFPRYIFFLRWIEKEQGEKYILINSPMIKTEDCSWNPTFPSCLHVISQLFGCPWPCLLQFYFTETPPPAASNTLTPSSCMAKQAHQSPWFVLHGCTNLISPCPHSALSTSCLAHPGEWRSSGSLSARLCCLVPCSPSSSLKQDPDTNDKSYWLAQLKSVYYVNSHCISIKPIKDVCINLSKSLKVPSVNY